LGRLSTVQEDTGRDHGHNRQHGTQHRTSSIGVMDWACLDNVAFPLHCLILWLNDYLSRFVFETFLGMRIYTLNYRPA
jgi:hypothetical protein